MKRKVDVVLLGHRFTVRTEKDEAYVHSLAAQVVRRLEDVRRAMRTASPHEQALLVALNLVDELIEERDRSSSARAEVRRHTESMIGKLSAALLEDAHGSASLLGPSDHEHDHEHAGVDDESDGHAVAVAVQRQA